MVVVVLCLSQGYGGLELYVLREIRALMARGIKCIPVVARHSMIGEMLNSYGIQVEYIEVLNKRLPLLAAAGLAEILNNNKADVLHIHWNKDLNLAALAKAYSGKNIKLVYSRHMEITRNKRDIFHRWFYKRIDSLLVISKLLRHQALEYLPLSEDKIKLLYLGVTAPEGDKADCGIFFDSGQFPARSLNLALFSRIESYKGQHILVKAVSHLIEKGLDISATVIGHVMDKSYFDGLNKDIGDHGLDSYIQFREFVPNPTELMPCFDVVVLTTYCETFGLVLVEAMRAGVAVIGTNAGGVPEIIDQNKTGFLFEPGDEKSLADVIEKLYNDRSLLQKVAKQGRIKADDMFSEQQHFLQLEEFLRGMAS